LLLAIDTSAGTSAAVFDGERLIAKAIFDDRFGHAENIGEAITQVLQTAGIKARELGQVVVGRGPAPYTGLRVGMAAGISLARTLGIELLGVMALDAIAHSVSGNVVVTTDAKRSELFVARYENGTRVSGPEVVSPQQLVVPVGFEHVTLSCDAELVGAFAIAEMKRGTDLSDVSAIYLRSVDVNMSQGKKVSG